MGCALTSEFLRVQGHNVLEAKDGVDTLSVVRAVRNPDRPAAYRRRHAQYEQPAPVRPATKFLFVSGYPRQTVLDHKLFDLEADFRQKRLILSSNTG